MPKSQWPIIWNARWIWASPAASPISPIAPAGTPPRETWNRFCYLRRTVNLRSIPASAPARVTADSRFVLLVNGAEISRGPARSVPERLAWTEIDLAPFLRIGRNAIAALARFYGLPGPWWRPAPPSFLIGFGSFAFESPAIGVSSDASWKGRAAPYRQDVTRGQALPAPRFHRDGPTRISTIPNGSRLSNCPRERSRPIASGFPLSPSSAPSTTIS